jgi:hypothetical protein
VKKRRPVVGRQVAVRVRHQLIGALGRGTELQRMTNARVLRERSVALAA